MKRKTFFLPHDYPLSRGGRVAEEERRDTGRGGGLRSYTGGRVTEGVELRQREEDGDREWGRGSDQLSFSWLKLPGPTPRISAGSLIPGTVPEPIASPGGQRRLQEIPDEGMPWALGDPRESVSTRRPWRTRAARGGRGPRGGERHEARAGPLGFLGSPAPGVSSAVSPHGSSLSSTSNTSPATPMTLLPTALLP